MPNRSSTPERKKCKSKSESSISFTFFKLIANFMVVCTFLLPCYYETSELMNEKNDISIFFNLCILVTVIYLNIFLFKILDFLLTFCK